MASAWANGHCQSEVIPNDNLKGTRVNLIFDLRSVGLHSVKVVRHPVVVLYAHIRNVGEDLLL